MASRRLLICNAIVAKLATITGITARWLHDGEADEILHRAEGDPPLAVVVPGPDSQRQVLNASVDRELLGHVIFQTYAGAAMTDATRATVDEQLTKVEEALLQLGDDASPTASSPGIPLSRTVPGVAEFNVLETATTFDGGDNGQFAARIDWSCGYRHDATNPRTYQGVA